MRVVVIGGGIGGLSAAIALHRIGCTVTILEKSCSPRPGSGLGIWSNAVAALGELGVSLAGLGRPFTEVGVWTPAGKHLAQVDLTWVMKGIPSYYLHRADLLARLTAKLPPELLIADECIALEELPQQVKVHRREGSCLAADLVVGADGFNSLVRAHLWGKTRRRYAGQTCYRGIADYSLSGGVWQIQGRGARAGISPVDGQRVYWWIARNAPAREPEVQERATYLGENFGHWPAHLGRLIHHTPEILRNDLWDRTPLTHWSRGRITLLGDAAHPTTPNLGQGACMAIEDGVVLARALGNHPKISEALRVYEQQRQARTAQVTIDSWRLGQVARWTNPALIQLREQALHRLPTQLLAWQLGRFLEGV